MPRFHHANLAVPPGGLEAQATFLVDVLGYRTLDPGERIAAMGAIWFEGEDGVQIHLSADPEHRPAAKAHVAVDFGEELPAVLQRLSDAGREFETFDLGEGSSITNCCDPSGNRWELRGRVPAPS